MYKRLYTFLNNNNIIYNLQFGFRQQSSTSHALIIITGKIRKALEDENISCGVFVDLQYSPFQIHGFAIFDSYLSYCFIAWAQNCSTIQRIVIL